MKIMLFIEGIVDRAGGASKVLCNMANEMTRRGHKVHIICNDAKNGMPFYPLDDRVSFHNLNGTGKKWHPPQTLKILRDLTNPLRKLPFFCHLPNPVQMWKFKQVLLKLASLIADIKPDVAIPFFLDNAALLAEKPINLQCPIILMLHNSPIIEYFNQYRLETLRSILSQCQILQVLLPSFAASIKQRLAVKTVVIPNAVPQFNEGDLVNLTQVKKTRTISMFARLDVVQKQPHFLIEAFAKIASAYPDWHLEFYGAEYTRGYQKTLERLIQKHHLEHQVFLKGTTNDPIGILKQSDIFAFPTAFEGFPLALTEAMSVGLPTIGLKTAPAVNELIVDGVNGFLAENNHDDFAAKLRTLMDDAELRVKMGRAGHEMMEQYAPEKIWDQWEELITTTVRQ